MRKTAIVTGAAGGIGYAVTEKLVSEDFQVVAMDVLPGEKVSPLFEKFGDHVRYIQADLSVHDDRQRIVDSAEEFFGQIGVLVNVAGIAPKIRADILEMTEESYDRVMNVNTKGTLFMTQLCANKMLQNECDENGIRGFIVNISSMSAYTSSVSRGEYCISKAGVSMITSLFADRLAEHGILVNEIRPGIIATGMTATVKQKYDRLIFEEGILPVKRWGQPEDIAKAVFVLCNGDLGYTTGQSVDVDGGFHIRRL